MNRFALALALLSSTVFAENGVVIDFQKVLKESNYGYRARETAEKRTRDKSAEEKNKAELEEYEKVYATALPLLVDWAKRQKLDFVFLTERGVVHADPFLTDYVTKDFIETLNRHSREPRASFDNKPITADRWTLRVAVINVAAVFEYSNAGKAAKASAQEQFKKAQAELDKLQAEAKELGKKLEAEKKGTEEYEKANSAFADKMRSVMTIKQMRDYELNFFQKKAIEEVMEQVRKATSTVASAQGFNLVLDAEDARVIARAPALEITQAVIETLNAPEAAAKKKAPAPTPKPTIIATLGFRQLWGELQKANPKAEPGTLIPQQGAQYAESAGLQLILDEENFVYANPARSRTAEFSKKLSGE